MTLSSIRSYLRVLIDQPSTAIFSNTALNTIINGAYRDIIGEVLRRNPKYFHTSSTVTTTASTPYTDLPSDCVNLNKLVNSDNDTLGRLDLTQQNMDETSGQPTNFDITGPHIFWWPIPDTTYTYTIYYHYMPTDMSADSDAPTLPPAYHDLIAWGAAINSRMIKEEQIPEYMMQYKNKLNMLLHSVVIDTTNEAPRVKPAYHDFYIYNS